MVQFWFCFFPNTLLSMVRYCSIPSPKRLWVTHSASPCNISDYHIHRSLLESIYHIDPSEAVIDVISLRIAWLGLVTPLAGVSNYKCPGAQTRSPGARRIWWSIAVPIGKLDTRWHYHITNTKDQEKEKDNKIIRVHTF